MKNKISKVEQGVILAAFLVCAVQIALIGYGSWKLGLVVPTCVTDVQPFESGKFITHASDRYEVHMVAKMWAFEPNVIRVPKGSTVDFYLTSKDINHGFQIDRTNINLNATPGAVNYAQARFTKPGIYAIVCNEYCGTAHHQMNGRVEVVDSTEPGSAEGVTGSAGSAAPAAGGLDTHPALAIFAKNGCNACHSLDGAKSLGPTFKGLYGRRVEFADGSSIAAADEAFMRESIQHPSKKIEKSYAPIMPATPVSEADIDQIIDYLKKSK